MAPGFLRKGRGGPLKTPTAKFVRGRGDECTPLSATLSRLHILPPLAPPPSPVPHLLSAPHHLTRKRSRRGPPYCTNDPANYVFKVFGSCENSFGSAVEGGRAVGEERRGEERVGEGCGVVHGLMAIITAQAFM